MRPTRAENVGGCPFVEGVSSLWSKAVSKQAVKLAGELLDRFFRDAEGRTNRQLDVYFTLQDLDLSRDRAEPALDELVRRGLLNTFGPDIAFLTEAGVAAAVNEQPIDSIGKVERPFGGAASDPEPGSAANAPEAETTEADSVAAEGPRIVHIGLEGNEYTVPLEWVCSVGRAEANDIVVNDKRASKRHAEIRFENYGYTLYDLDSANGTLLNGEYVVDPIVLKPDDEVVIGRTLLLYQAQLPVPEPTGPKPAVSAQPSIETPSMDLEATEIPPVGDEGQPVVPEALLEAPVPATTEPSPPAPDFPRAEPDLEPEIMPEPEIEPAPELESAPDLEAEPELLDPSALEPLEPEEEMDPTPPSAEIPRFPPDEAIAGETSWVPEPVLPGAEEPLEDDEEAAATIMTTREAIFGEVGPPAPEASATDSSGDQETLPPGRVAPPPEILARVEREPALFAFLRMLRARVEEAELSDRGSVLAAIDLLCRDPEVRELIRAIEDENA